MNTKAAFLSTSANLCPGCLQAGGAAIGGLTLVGLVHMVGVMAIVLEVVALLLVGLYKIIPKFDD